MAASMQISNLRLPITPCLEKTPHPFGEKYLNLLGVFL